MRNKKNNKQSNPTRKNDHDRDMTPKSNTRSDHSAGKAKNENEEVSKPYDEDVAAEMSVRSRRSKRQRANELAIQIFFLICLLPIAYCLLHFAICPLFPTSY